jgi:ketosteroid isomerase-like protein
MSSLDNVTVARTFHQAWDDRDPDRGAAVIANDCEFVDVPARNASCRVPYGEASRKAGCGRSACPV